MTTTEIKEIQRTIGAKVDGIWGKESSAKCKAYLRDLMPVPNPWPKETEAELKKFFGPVCDEGQLVSVTAPCPLYFSGKLVKKIRCHKKVADSLCRALAAAYDECPNVVSIYDGIYNCRNIAGSTKKSCHARGIAIDIDAENNGAKTPWPKRAEMPLVVMEKFAAEGWLAGGAFWSVDGMHFQSTR
jgi:D-alanyl-D-alanine carboxypeptidase